MAEDNDIRRYSFKIEQMEDFDDYVAKFLSPELDSVIGDTMYLGSTGERATEHFRKGAIDTLAKNYEWHQLPESFVEDGYEILEVRRDEYERRQRVMNDTLKRASRFRSA